MNLHGIWIAAGITLGVVGFASLVVWWANFCDSYILYVSPFVIILWAALAHVFSYIK